jgi:hypothetical protein
MGDFAEDDPADSARNTIPTDVNTGKGGPKPQPVFSRINDAVTPPHVRQAMREDEIRGLMEGGTSTAY